MPTLNWRSQAGSVSEIEFGSTGPTFVTLWASWCETCVLDLRTLTESQASLAERHLKVLAISADGIEGSFDDAQNVLDVTEFPFENGFADEALARQLTELIHHVYYRKLDLALPTSFLLDARGHVAVIYKGAIDADQIIADVDLLVDSKKKLLSTSFPFSGVQVPGKFEPTAIDLANSYLAGNYFDDARQQIERYLASIESVQDLGQLANELSTSLQGESPLDSSALKKTLEKQKALAKIKGLKLLAQIHRADESPQSELKALQEILKLDPNDLPARLSTAIAFEKLGQKQKAVDLLRMSEQLVRTDVNAMLAIVQTYMKLNQRQPANRIARRLHEEHPKNLNVRFNFAMVSQISGDEVKAIELYESILAESPNANDVANNLAWLYANANDSKLWNLKRAKSLATALCQRSENRNAAYLDTLSGILIKTGDRKLALEAAVTAAQIARQSGQIKLVTKIEQRIAELQRLP